MPRVAITGAHSAGKTTLTLALAEKTGIPSIRGDTVRDIVRERFPGKLMENMTLPEKWIVEKANLDNRLRAEATQTNFVADGCTINSVVYALAYCGDAIKTFPDYETFKTTALSNAHNYTHILYLPSEIGLENDGFRPTSQDFREKVDRILDEILDAFPIRVLLGSVERRIERALQFLGLNTSPSMWDNYIAFEGLDTAAKTVQMKLLQEHATSNKIPLHVVQHLRDGTIVREIEQLKLSDPCGNAYRIAELSTELQIKEFKSNLILERLEAEQMVISDRQKFSIMALGGSLGRISLANLYAITRNISAPGKVIYLRTQPATADGIYTAKAMEIFDKLGRRHGFCFVDGHAADLAIHLKIVKAAFHTTAGSKSGESTGAPG
ncbi:Thymidylate kinase [Candidatus Burarchaeum australiense]|nr:Thymidylate kinase [Candidatus Burarchaeum australiense]